MRCAGPRSGATGRSCALFGRYLFDEFRDFEDRGRRFKALVAALEERRVVSA
jgi:hypothetical protein